MKIEVKDVEKGTVAVKDVTATPPKALPTGASPRVGRNRSDALGAWAHQDYVARKEAFRAQDAEDHLQDSLETLRAMMDGRLVGPTPDYAPPMFDAIAAAKRDADRTALDEYQAQLARGVPRDRIVLTTARQRARDPFWRCSAHDTLACCLDSCSEERAAKGVRKP